MEITPRIFFCKRNFSIIGLGKVLEEAPDTTLVHFQAEPVYNLFINVAKNIEPNYISMVTPSRWFSGGKGLDDFRDEMLQDDRMQKIIDYIDNEMLFSGVAIVGGVNYFLWNSCEIFEKCLSFVNFNIFFV